MKVVVSAGPTWEAWDTVRYIGNLSSGRMGYAIAAAAHRRGHDVTLVSGPTRLPPPRNVTTRHVESALEMQLALREAFIASAADALVMAAAVADFRPARRHRSKIDKSGPEGLTLRLVRNPDILAGLARNKGNAIVAGFALEGGRGLERARAKLRKKRLDLIVFNRPETLGADTIDATILFADDREPISVHGRKTAVAGRLIRILEGLHAERKGGTEGTARVRRGRNRST